MEGDCQYGQRAISWGNQSYADLFGHDPWWWQWWQQWPTKNCRNIEWCLWAFKILKTVTSREIQSQVSGRQVSSHRQQSWVSDFDLRLVDLWPVTDSNDLFQEQQCQDYPKWPQRLKAVRLSWRRAWWPCWQMRVCVVWGDRVCHCHR